ncbi:MAG: YfhD family protein [Paenibacillaceae bacterium]
MTSENKSKVTSKQQTERQKNLPIASSKDVEFSSEAADIEDVEAQQRAARANNRQNNPNK